MASRNEYEMLFKLSAQLGQNFNGTFSSAQKTLAATQKEIQSLNKLQSDISSYTKQQQSVDALKTKLSTYQQQLRNVQQEISASGEYSSALANKELDLKQKIEQTEASLRQKTETLDRMGDALSEAGVDMGNLSGETERLGKEVDDLKEKQEKAADEAQRFGDVGANSAIAVADALAAAGIAKILKEIYEAYGECIVGAASFGDEIGTVSVQYGIAAQDLQAYYYAAELVDVSVETLTSTMAKNVRSMSEAQSGTERYAEAYERLKVEVTNADGSLRDSEDVYWDVIDALGDMENASERDALAMELLGRSAQQINTLIAAGSGVMDEYSQMAEKAGYIMDEKMLASAMALDDELQIQKNNMTALKNTIGAQFAPEITAALKLWNNMLAGMTKFAEENPVIVKSLVVLGLELATIVGIYGGYVAIKKTATALKALSAALTAKDAAASTADAAAKTAQATATTAATAAQTGLNAAMMANPIGLIIGAVALLTVGIVALTTAMNKEADQEEKLTAVTKKHKAEREQLNAEYEEACEVYGETSEEASRLRYEMEELDAAIEQSGQTVEEFVDECNELAESSKQAIADYKEATEEIRQNELSAFALIQKLSDLAAQNEKTAATEEKMKNIIAELNEQIPDLALSYEDLTADTENYVAAMKALAKQKAEDDRQQARMEEYSKAITRQSALIRQISELEENLRLERESDSESWEAVDAYSKQLAALRTQLTETENTISTIEREWEEYAETMGDGALSAEEFAKQERLVAEAANAVATGYMTAEQAAKYYGVDLSKVEAKTEELYLTSSALASALKAVRNGFLTAEAAAKAYGVTVESIGAYRNITDITSEINELSEAYHDLYQEAEDSIKGQYKLWDKAAEVIPADLAEITTALETQTAYWHDYNADLKSLNERAKDIEGLSEMVASFADGSAESVNIVAGLAQASDEEIRQMVEQWKELSEEESAATETLVESKDEYTDTIEALKQQLEQTIDDLNLSEEAKNAAEATMDAYIKALQEGADEAVQIAEQLAVQVGTALSSQKDTTNDSSSTSSSSNSKGTYQDYLDSMYSKYMGTAPTADNRWSSYSEAADAGFSNIMTRTEWGRRNSSSGSSFVSPVAPVPKITATVVKGENTGLNMFAKTYTPSEYNSMLKTDESGNTYIPYTANGHNAYVKLGEGYDYEKDKKGNYKVDFHSWKTLYDLTTTYHSGGLVGDVATLSESEEFAKLLKGEFVSTPAQMKHFMEDTLPQVAEYGAETVAPVPVAEAQSTQGAIYTVTIAPNFTLQGVEGDNMEDKFRECGDMVVDMVIDRLEEMGIDAKRGAYV